MQVSGPEKGAFPLDHFHECSEQMKKYMQCLKVNENHPSRCKEESKAYLGCRMDKELMAKEEWKHLGFEEDDKEKK
ncbi:hypothetical protein PROFUN_14368 [Planoprotostelium fungivorum]|uniref:Cytochrome c oxidase assembly protein COX19 n=1 Tax=Planoprotostelium fungivorum TaxID=1890364 RepID=A0A2P6N0B3_9EUKA|nr:hypothetical protein PROFUN_14368 [Planoprotostelium fungivorum]